LQLTEKVHLVSDINKAKGSKGSTVQSPDAAANGEKGCPRHYSGLQQRALLFGGDLSKEYHRTRRYLRSSSACLAAAAGVTTTRAASVTFTQLLIDLHF
jgi:hypothetical protein